MRNEYAFLAALASLLSAGAAHAAPSYVFTLSPAAFLGAGSGKLHLDATFANNTGARVYLNAIEQNMGAFGSYVVALSDDGFLDTAPLFLEANTSATFAAYDVTYANAPGGLFPIFTAVDIQISPDDSTYDPVYSSNLPTLLIAGTPAPAVPEPAGWAMAIAGLGLAGASLRATRRRVSLAL